MSTQPAPCGHVTCSPGRSTSFRWTWTMRSPELSDRSRRVVARAWRTTRCRRSPRATSRVSDLRQHLDGRALRVVLAARAGRRARGAPRAVVAGSVSRIVRHAAEHAARRQWSATRHAAASSSGVAAETAGDADHARAVPVERCGCDLDVLGGRPAPVEVRGPQVDSSKPAPRIPPSRASSRSPYVSSGANAAFVASSHGPHSSHAA